MPLTTSTLRPGLLVALKTSISGNVKYFKKTIESDRTLDTGERMAKWETERLIELPEEHAEAVELRSKARKLISGICAQTEFGLLCPESQADRLDIAMTRARSLVEEFNGRAKRTRVNFFMLCGKINPDDVEAVRAINSEISELLVTMARGLEKLDVAEVRKAAERVAKIAIVLAPDAQARVQDAVDAARATARKIVKAGETVAQEIDTQTIALLARTQAAFLDLDIGGDVAAPEAEARAIDLEPEATEAQQAWSVPTVVEADEPVDAYRDLGGYAAAPQPQIEL